MPFHRLRPGALCRAVALLALVSCALPARADGGDDVAARIAAIAASEDAADAPRLARDGAMSSGNALAFVGALTGHGGARAAEALGILSHHQDPAVRRAALDGIGVVGVRLAAATGAAAAALAADRDGAVRAAAAAALGIVGGGAEVPALIEALGPGDARQRGRAHAALTRLTGARLPADPRRWATWWDRDHAAPRAELHAALDVVAAGAPADRVEASRRVVASAGWRDVAAVRDAAQQWLRSASPRLREEGYRAAGVLALGDLASEVASNAGYERAPATVELARGVVQRLLGRPTALESVSAAPCDVADADGGVDPTPTDDLRPVRPASAPGGAREDDAPVAPARVVARLDIGPTPIRPRASPPTAGPVERLPPPPVRAPMAVAVLPASGWTRWPFSWDDVPGADGYLVEVERWNGAIWTPIVRRSVPWAAWTIARSEAGDGLLRWRVRACAGTSAGRATSWRAVVVSPRR